VALTTSVTTPEEPDIEEPDIEEPDDTTTPNYTIYYIGAVVVIIALAIFFYQKKT